MKLTDSFSKAMRKRSGCYSSSPILGIVSPSNRHHSQVCVVCLSVLGGESLFQMPRLVSCLGLSCKDWVSCLGLIKTWHFQPPQQVQLLQKKTKKVGDGVNVNCTADNASPVSLVCTGSPVQFYCKLMPALLRT